MLKTFRALAQEHGDHDAYKIAELVLRIVADEARNEEEREET